jgi:cyclohexadieny/prephenate dehydrogenase
VARCFPQQQGSRARNAPAFFSEDLTALQRAIRYGKGDELEALFARTRDIRRSIVEQGQDDDAPDFGRKH